MRVLLLVSVITAATLSGCTGLEGEIAIHVTAARVLEGDCTFGPRDNASDPEWCHELDVQVSNNGTNDIETSADRWEAFGDDGHRYTFPRVIAGATDTTVDASATESITLRFDAPETVRLTDLMLLERDPAEGRTTGASATVPAY